jgi:chromosomal replication initiator protein
VQAVQVQDRYADRLREIARHALPRPYHVWFKILDEVDAKRPDKPSIRVIQDEACQHYNISRGDMISRRRQLALTLPRQMAMHLCRKLTMKSYPTIAAMFGDRDHSTILHASRKIERLADVDADVSSDLATLIGKISKRWGSS